MRYFGGFLIAVGIIIVVLILIFRGGGPEQKPLFLPDYAPTAAVAQYTIDGSVSNPETHRQIQITVGNSSAVLTVIKGYQGEVVRSQTYPMDQAAYEAFLYALQRSGYTEGDNDQKLADERGYCPTGQRYIYEMLNGDKQLLRYWSTSCGSTKTFKGNDAIVRRLFIKQIPDYDTLTSSVNL